MDSAKIDIKELLLATKIKNTNEKIKWVVIGSFLFTLLVSTLAGITLFSRYLDNLMNGKREAIVVKLQIPDAKIPLSFMYPPATTWPMPMFEERSAPSKTAPALTEQHIGHIDKDKHKPKIKADHLAYLKPTKKIAKINHAPVHHIEAKAPPKPKIVDKLTSNVIPPGYIKIGKDVYFNPETSKYLMKWD